jgi:arginyl-tRNA synthetase
MLKSQREQLAAALLESLHKLASSLGRPLEFDQAMVEESLDKPRQAEHGDIASNIALRLAKPLAMPPAKIGQTIADSLRADRQLQAVCEEISVAGPGFINLRLRSPVIHSLLALRQWVRMRPMS